MERIGGAEGDRTPDLRNAIATLSQLSYGPTSLHAPLGEAFPAEKGKFQPPSRIQALLGFLVLAGRLDAEIVVAGREIDFLVGARLLVLVDRQIVGGEIGILRRLPSAAGAATSNGIGCFDFSTGSGSHVVAAADAM